MTDRPTAEDFAALGRTGASYADIGVTWLSVPFSGVSRDALLASIEQFAELVIRPGGQR